jgi:hypothetical protein
VVDLLIRFGRHYTCEDCGEYAFERSGWSKTRGECSIYPSEKEIWEDGTSVFVVLYPANVHQRQGLSHRIHSQGISWRGIHVSELLIQGGFARCYLVTNRQGRPFAAKVVAKASLKTPKAKGKVTSLDSWLMSVDWRNKSPSKSNTSKYRPLPRMLRR